MNTGTLFIISAPSGAGKTSLVAKLLESVSTIQASISHTTRPCRPGERDGVNYHFTDHRLFESMIADGVFLEYAKVFDHYYGTSEQWVKASLAKGIDVILERDWQGAEQARMQFPESRSIFILPPSMSALEARLNNRGQDNADVIKQRIGAAKEEISHYIDADYLIINDHFDIALSQLESIVMAQRCHITAMKNEPVLKDLLS